MAGTDVPNEIDNEQAGFFGTQSFDWDANLGANFRTHSIVKGTIKRPELERLMDVHTLADIRTNQSALIRAREHLQNTGFTAAPCSQGLIRLLREVPVEQLGNAGKDFQRCVGRSRSSLFPPHSSDALDPSITSIVKEALDQLQMLLPSDAVVVGLVEGTYRHGGISWLHFDEIRNSDGYVWQVLFPSSSREAEEVQNMSVDNYEHYKAVQMLVEEALPGMCWPLAGQAQDKEHETQLLEHIKAAIADYNCRAGLNDPLTFECINVWIPKAEKQLAMLSPEHLKETKFYDTRPSAEEVESAGFQHNFEAFGRGVATFFFGRYVMHQAAVGPEFSLSQGSMEMRYLILLPHSRVPRHQCIGRGASAQTGMQEKTADVKPDIVGECWPW